MSWQINGTGHYFHDWAAYQRAREAAQKQSAQAQLRRETSRLRSSLSSLNPELARARGNAARQQELSRDLANHAADAAESLRRFEAATAAELQQLERDRDHLRQSVDRSQHDVAQIEAGIAQHTAEVKAQCAAARQEFDAVINDLQTQRQQLDARIRSEKQELENRLEKARADRLAKAANETEKAGILLAEASAAAQSVEASARQINHGALLARMQSLQANIARARTLGAAAGLAEATQLGIEARVAAAECEQATVAMQGDLRRVNSLGERINEILNQPLVAKLYPARHRVLQRDLTPILAPAAEVYANYEIYSVERPRHLRELEDILGRAERCAADAPMDEARLLERDKSAMKSVGRYLDECPEPAEIVKEELKDKNDPLSDLLVTVKSASETRIYEFEISGRERRHAFGHRNNADCRASLAREQTSLANDLRVDYQALDHTTLGSEPAPPPPPPPISTREDLDRRDQA